MVSITYKVAGGQYEGSGINTQGRRFSAQSIARFHVPEVNEDDASTTPQDRSDRRRGTLIPQPSQRSAIATQTDNTENTVESPSMSSTGQITDVYETPKRRGSSSVEIEDDDGDDDTYKTRRRCARVR